MSNEGEKKLFMVLFEILEIFKKKGSDRMTYNV